MAEKNEILDKLRKEAEEGKISLWKWAASYGSRECFLNSIWTVSVQFDEHFEGVIFLKKNGKCYRNMDRFAL